MQLCVTMCVLFVSSSCEVMCHYVCVLCVCVYVSFVSSSCAVVCHYVCVICE